MPPFRCAPHLLQSPSKYLHTLSFVPTTVAVTTSLLFFFSASEQVPSRANLPVVAQLRHGSTPSITSGEQSQHGLETRGGQTTEQGQWQAGGARRSGVGERHCRGREQSADTPVRSEGDAPGHRGRPRRGCRGHRPSVSHSSRWGSWVVSSPSSVCFVLCGLRHVPMPCFECRLCAAPRRCILGSRTKTAAARIL